MRIILKENYEPDSELEWIGLVSFVIGLLFLLVSLFSFCGIVSVYCRAAVIPSGYIALFLSVLSLILGIISVICEIDILDYIDKKGSSKVSITQSQVDTVHEWYRICAVGLFILFVIETCRFILSSQYAVTSSLLDGDYEMEASESLIQQSSGRYQIDDEEEQYSGRTRRDVPRRNGLDQKAGYGRNATRPY